MARRQIYKHDILCVCARGAGSGICTLGICTSGICASGICTSVAAKYSGAGSPCAVVVWQGVWQGVGVDDPDAAVLVVADGPDVLGDDDDVIRVTHGVQGDVAAPSTAIFGGSADRIEVAGRDFFCLIATN